MVTQRRIDIIREGGIESDKNGSKRVCYYQTKIGK